MKRAAVSTIKAILSACLAKVKAGKELLVMERGKPVAKLVPVSTVDDAQDGGAHLRDLARAGLVRVGSGKLPTGFWTMPRPRDRKGLALAALLNDRVEGPDEVLGCVSIDPAPPESRRSKPAWICVS